ncbi:magnesium/cobalt transporter CorA [Phycicoccus sp. BSK3Z-2]|uniref:Magnesium transport protein CorA n=1 Tax=Phycicoccus avicenniae TaxID=2828860 RepID=A0A941D6C4_9MICO|nr:magnesium/cobalt transporter CorA [Phycicoccus avicenniae]MBR7742271.1 magnesium/cobalt transporter CorA [Phycicoccus avicenniae]
MIVDRAIYEGGSRRDCGDLADELRRLREGPDDGGFLWIGLKDPTEEEFSGVDTELGIHPLAVEDALETGGAGRRRPKVEHYDGLVFVVLSPLRYIDRTSDIETGELMVFVGDRFVVTVRRGELSPLDGVRRSLEADPQRLALGPFAVLHEVLDRTVDGYLAIDREVEQDLDEMESVVFSPERTDTASIYALKREVLEFRRAVVPLADPLRMLHSSPRSPVPDGELRLLLRDVADHLVAVIDHVETYDSLLSGILDAYLAQVSVQQNDDMRKISAWVAIAAVPTLIAGIYGMNFTHMPELDWTYGYPLTVGLMAGVCGTLYGLFRRAGWL